MTTPVAAIVTARGKTYHAKHRCGSGPQSPGRVAATVQTQEMAIEAGKRPCALCWNVDGYTA